MRVLEREGIVLDMEPGDKESVELGRGIRVGGGGIFRVEEIASAVCGRFHDNHGKRA